MKSWIETVKYILRSMEDGEITISAYDTAWIALVPALNGSAEPQFPSSLQWLIDNQLQDGSWGDPHMFLIRDRIINTLACVLALKTWNTFSLGVNKGLIFLQTYIPKMNDEHDAHTPVGFEIVFPALMEDAKIMGLDLPYDAEFLQKIHDEKALKMKRIPMKVLHEFPSTLLHSLEGLRDKVEWEKILKLQSKNGSFLFSPASTACALAQTSDINCLRYLNEITEKYDGGAPNVYPVDLFERLWTVDRIERLGIARYFESEITDSLEYVYRYWTNEGIGWARDSPVKDVDDTSMAFRLLRSHGFDVTAEAFNHFKQDDQFFCFFGQTKQTVTGMYNLYRASQLLFPGESILELAREFTKNFLEEKRAEKQLRDKWIIAKGLKEEVEYALKFPWYASQARIATRLYINQYRVDDVWIGKALYRMPIVNNKTYIELAKADFNICQSIHRTELQGIIRWYRESGLDELGLRQDQIVKSYFLSAVAIYEPDMAPARLAWAKSAVLMAAIRIFFSGVNCLAHHRSQFLDAFTRWKGRIMRDSPSSAKRLFSCLFRTVNLFSVDGVVSQGRDISGDLRHTWERWLASEAEDLTDAQEHEKLCTDAEIVVLTAAFLGGETISSDLLSHPDFSSIMKVTNTVCSLLRRIATYKDEGCDSPSGTEEDDRHKRRAEEGMGDLVRAVYRHQCGPPVPIGLKRLCLVVAKSFYYAAHCNNEEVENHVKMVLFQPVY